MFFIDGPRLKEAEIRAMQELQAYVNIIPVLSKADAYSYFEILAVKTHILTECSS